MLKRLNRFTTHNDLWFHTKEQQFRALHYSYTMGKMNPALWLARGCQSTPITNEKARGLTSSRVMWRSGQLKSSGAVWFYTNWILIGVLTLSANFYQPINVYRVEIENQITRLFFLSMTKGLFQWNNETIQTLLYSVLLMRNKNSFFFLLLTNFV